MNDDDETMSGANSADDGFAGIAKPITGPPGFVKAAEMQRAYWTFSATEQAALQLRGFPNLSRPQRREEIRRQFESHAKPAL